MLSKISPTNLLPSNMQLNIETYLCITLLLAFLKLLGHVRLFVTPCPPGSSVHGITQARILELVAIPFSRRSSQPRDQTQASRITDGFLTIWATREAHCLLVRIIKKKKNKKRKKKTVMEQNWKQFLSWLTVRYLLESSLINTGLKTCNRT